MTDITLERHIDASPEQVFSYFTSSERWSAWQGASTTIDAKVGGAYRMIAPNGGVASGTVLELVPSRLIVFSWGWEGHPKVPPGSSTVRIELTAQEGKTIVKLTHSGLPPDETGLHRMGWDHYLERLGSVSSGHDPGPDAGLGGT